MKKKYQATPLILVDGNNLLYRAAYGFPTRIFNRKKEDITAIFAFFALLRIAFVEFGYPLSPIICFDGENALDKRRILMPSYKENRNNNRQNPYADLPLLLTSLKRIGLPFVLNEDSEADDLIAHLVFEHRSQREIAILSTDKDFYQLLDTNVSVLNTSRKKGERVVTADTVFDRFGVSCRQWIYYRALMGDPADFIKGVPGVGPKTAAWLLTLPEVNLKEVLNSKYHTGWQTFMNYVAIISLLDGVDYELDVLERELFEFETPAKIIEQLGLWG